MKIIYLFFFFFSVITQASSPWEGLTLNGKEVIPKKNTHWVLAVLWASWCRDCKNHIRKDIPQLKKQYPQLEIFLINVEKNTQRAIHTLKKLGQNPFLIQDKDKIFRKKLKAFSVPHWALYQKQEERWVLIASEPGFNTEKIKALISKKL